MAVFIHRTPQFTKCLQKLRRAGGRAELAAERAEKIIAQLGPMTDTGRGRSTA